MIPHFTWFNLSDPSPLGLAVEISGSHPGCSAGRQIQDGCQIPELHGGVPQKWMVTIWNIKMDENWGYILPILGTPQKAGNSVNSILVYKIANSAQEWALKVARILLAGSSKFAAATLSKGKGRGAQRAWHSYLNIRTCFFLALHI